VADPTATAPAAAVQVQLVVPMTCLLTVGRVTSPWFMLPESCRECWYLHQEIRQSDTNE